MNVWMPRRRLFTLGLGPFTRVYGRIHTARSAWISQASSWSPDDFPQEIGYSRQHFGHTYLPCIGHMAPECMFRHHNSDNQFSIPHPQKLSYNPLTAQRICNSMTCLEYPAK